MQTAGDVASYGVKRVRLPSAPQLSVNGWIVGSHNGGQVAGVCNMEKQLQRCVECGEVQENCIQRRDGTWRCPACIQEIWEKTNRRMVYRAGLAASARRGFAKAR